MDIPKSRRFFYLLLIISILKLALVARNEIVAIPYDSEGYIRQAASHLYELGAPPGYPLWLALSGLSGVPQRISIEILLIFSSFVLSCWLKRMFGELCALLTFSMIVLSPATYFLFDYALTDGFYGCLSILAITLSGILIFSARRRIQIVSGVALGIVLGWMALSRNEDPLLVAWVGMLLSLLALRWFRMRSNESVRFPFSHVILVGIAIAGPAAGLVQGVNLIHWHKSGVFARTLPGLPGHMRMLRQLAEIKTGEADIHYVPVSAKARSLAYRASPTLGKYAGAIENRDSIFQNVSREAGLPLGEIGAGWIWHVFNVAILEANGVVQGAREYERINAELASGFESGLLKKRFILHSFAAAPVSEILRRLPEGVWEVAKKTFQTYPQGSDVGQEKELFDAVALRRSALTGGGYKHAIQGWAFVNDRSDRKIESVMSVGGAGQKPVTVSYMPRKDVEQAFKKPDGSIPSVIGFKFDFYSSSRTAGKLLYLFQDGSTMFVDELAAGVKSIGPGSASPGLLQGIDFSTAEPVVRTGYRHRLQSLLSSVVNIPIVSGALVIVLFVLSILPFFASAHVRKGQSRIRIFILLVLAMFLLRIFFYAMLDSEAWAVEMRYMLASNFMAAILIAVSVSFWMNTPAARSGAEHGSSSPLR
jgi:hypothetical protein